MSLGYTSKNGLGKQIFNGGAFWKKLERFLRKTLFDSLPEVDKWLFFREIQAPLLSATKVAALS